jgi:predicted MFS family arabinose efflux permease
MSAVTEDTRPGQQGRTYILLLLTLVYAFNHFDRQVLLILQGEIKAEFDLSDGQLGLLSGLFFAAFYSTLGIPAAMWADRGVRKNIVALALAIWSGMTALSGLAQNYLNIALARMGVAIGEAGGTPPSTSMIADLYAPEERATAMGIYTLGIGLGIMAGFPFGDYILSQFGWRVAFFAAGVPGIILSAIVFFTIKEPIRGASDAARDHGNAPGFFECLSFIGKQWAFVWLLVGCTLICISANAYLAWVPELMARSYEFADGERGLALGILIGGFGCAGAIMMGMVTDKLSARSLRWRPLMIALCGAVAIPFVYFALNAETKWAFYTAYAVPSFIGLIYASIAYTAAQELVVVRMRSFAAAFTLLCLTLLGIGLGPTVTGWISDAYAAAGSEASLRDALLTILALNVLSLPALILSARFYEGDVLRASQGLNAN